MCGAWESNPAPFTQSQAALPSEHDFGHAQRWFFSYSFIESVLWLKPNPIVLPPDPNPTQIWQRAGVGSPLAASLSDGQLRRTALAA